MAVPRRGLIGGAALLVLLGTLAVATPVAAAPGSAFPVTTPTSNEQMPKWSPDGSRLAFWSDRDGTGPFGLYAAAPDGTGTTRLVDAAAYSVRDFSWSPDGTKIAFAAGRVGSEGCVSLYVVDASGSGQPQVVHEASGTISCDDASPTWASSNTIVYASAREGVDDLFVVTLAGVEQRLPTGPGSEQYPAVSPDGTLVAYVSPDGCTSDEALWVLPTAGGSPSRVTDCISTVAFIPVWSPDSHHLAMAVANLANDPQGFTDLYVADAAGAPGSEHRATTAAGNEVTPSWSPDSARLVFGSDRTGVFELYSVAADGTGPTTTLTRGVGHDQNPTVSPDGASVAFDSSRTCNFDVFVIPVSGEATPAGRPAQCAASGRGRANLFDALSESIPLEAFVTSENGLPLPGLVTLTASFTASAPLPPARLVAPAELKVTAPAGTATTASILWHESVFPPGTPQNRMAVSRDGVVVPACHGDGPDPCLLDLALSQHAHTAQLRGTDLSGKWNLIVEPGFVTRDGTTLLVDGQPFRPMGLNIYNANSNGFCASAFGGTQLSDSLSAMGPGKNVLRAWFFQQLATTNGQRDWTAFDRTLATARAQGYRVVATLIDQWGNCGAANGQGYGYKDAAWYQSGYTQPDPSAIVSYRDWVAEVVQRYQGDPTILSWQLVNEPEVGDCTAVPEAQATARLRSFAADVSSIIRSFDPNHLISLGTLGGGQCGAQGDDYQTVMSVPTLDLCEYHDYTPGELVPGDQFNGLQRRIDQCNALGKPLVVGEMGVQPNDVGGTLARRADVVASKLCAQLTAGVAGVLLWNWSKDGSLLTDYDIGPGDPVLDVLGPWSDPSHTCSSPGAPLGAVAGAGDAKAMVAWMPPPSNGGSPITSYAVTASPGGATATVDGATSTANVAGLINGTAYTFTVTAVNARGSSVASAATTPVTPRAGASSPVVVVGSAAPNGTVTTDAAGTGATPQQPLVAALTVPAGGGVSMAVGAAGSAPVGTSVLGQQVTIAGPGGTAGQPLQLSLVIDASLVGATPPSAIEVFRSEGGGPPVTLPGCSGTAGTASPDPCVAGRTALAGGDVRIDVLTSSASVWGLAVAGDRTPPTVTLARVNGSPTTFPLSTRGPLTSLGGACGTATGDASTVRVTITGPTSRTGTAPCQAGGWTMAVSPKLSANGSYTVTVTQTDAAGNTGSSGPLLIAIDTVRPKVTAIALAGPSPTTAASVSWTVSFNEAVTGVVATSFSLVSTAPGTPPAISSVTGAGTAWTVTATAGTGDRTIQLKLAATAGIVDAAGNELASTLNGQTYRIDRTPPVITLTRPAAGASYVLGAATKAAYSCTDGPGGSGVASCAGTVANGQAIDTSSIGSKSFTVNAADVLANAAATSVSYRVVYPFTGYFAPVANPPKVNAVRAATTVPVSFSLGGDRGLSIMGPGSPSVQQIDCSTGAAIGAATAATGTLTYASGNGRYTFSWPSAAAWSGTCRQLVISLADGTSHPASFRFA